MIEEIAAAAGRSGPADRHPLLQSGGAAAAGRGHPRRRDAARRRCGKGCAFVTAIDKFPLIVKSSPGFLVNRVLAPYMMGAMQRLERGEAKEKIDEAARTFGMPMGPIELADTVGLDVCAHVGKILKIAATGPNKLERDGRRRQARQEVRRRLLRLEGRQAGEGRAREALRQVRAGAARARAGRAADPRGRARARREDRRQCATWSMPA